MVLGFHNKQLSPVLLPATWEGQCLSLQLLWFSLVEVALYSAVMKRVFHLMIKQFISEGQ